MKSGKYPAADHENLETEYKTVKKINHRCGYVNMKNPLYIQYHDYEWGVPQHSDQKLYELLLLECFQAGLSWECILNKRENFRRAFDGFDIDRVCGYDDKKRSELMSNSGIIRNRLKISAAVQNSLVFREIQREFGSFDRYIWGFTHGKVITEDYKTKTSSPLSDTISKDLKRRGMKFAGSTIIYSFLQAAGIINPHGSECDLCALEYTDGQI